MPSIVLPTVHFEALFAGCLGLLLLALIWYTKPVEYGKGTQTLPPGPKPDWIVGNRNQVPAEKPWRWFRELNQEYGDIVFLRMGRTPTVILGSAQVAWDLLEKRSNVTSGRPRFIMGQELLSNNMRGLMAGYNDFWKRWRKILHTSFNNRASDMYKPIQDLESKILLQNLLDCPDNYRDLIERYATSVVVSLTYGRRVEDIHNDEVVRLNRETQHYLTSVNIPGKYLVETIPALLYLPNCLTPWRQEALKQREIDIAYLSRLVEEVRQKMAANKAQVSLCKQLLEKQADLGMSDLEVAYTCATPFGAGVETTMGTLVTFMLACAAFGHEFIPKAQDELDRVVGTDRMPSWDDLAELPYVKAVVSETLRWRPIAVVGGTPHATTEDIDFRGHFIPKGTTIIANLWSIHLNEIDFPDPDHFQPERFLSTRTYPGKEGHSAFGWGRRVCTGQWVGTFRSLDRLAMVLRIPAECFPHYQLAQNSIFLNIARFLWAYDISPALDGDKNPIAVDINSFTNGFNSMPTPFPISIRARSLAQVAVIAKEFKEAQEEARFYD